MRVGDDQGHAYILERGPFVISVLFVVVFLIAVPLAVRQLEEIGDPRADRLLGLLRRATFPAIALLAVAYALGVSLTSGLLAVPWLVVASIGALAAGIAVLSLARHEPRALLRPARHHVAWAALVYLAIGAGNAAADRFGIQPFGFAPTIVLLTAVHFHVAGFVLLVAGLDVERVRPSRITLVALASVVVGMPVTAAGFFGVPLANLLGALLVAGGGAGIGVGLVRASSLRRGIPARVLSVVAGLSLLLAMPLAVAYAIGQATGSLWLDIPVMARTHGALVVLGFAIPATVGMAMDRRIDEGRGLALLPRPKGRGRLWPYLLGLVVGLIFGFAWLTGGTVAWALGLAAVALLALDQRRSVLVPVALVGFGAATMAVLLFADARCQIDCVGPDLTPWLLVGGGTLALGIVFILWNVLRTKAARP